MLCATAASLTVKPSRLTFNTDLTRDQGLPEPDGGSRMRIHTHTRVFIILLYIYILCNNILYTRVLFVCVLSKVRRRRQKVEVTHSSVARGPPNELPQSRSIVVRRRRLLGHRSKPDRINRFGVML